MFPAGDAYAMAARDFAFTVNALLIKKPLRGNRMTASPQRSTRIGGGSYA